MEDAGFILGRTCITFGGVAALGVVRAAPRPAG